MLAGVRFRFLLSFSLLLLVSLAFSATAALPALAQVTGVPASVTSLGFGGNFINGIRPSVPSLGPSGYSNTQPVFGNCCSNLFMPANPNPPLFSEHRHRRKDKDRDKNKDHKDPDRNLFAAGGYV